jgi:hypothetical protein
LADRQRAAHHRQHVIQAAITVAAVLLLFSVGLAAGMYWLPRLRPAAEQQMTCSEFQSHFDAFHRHLAGEAPMDAALVEKLTNHFRECNTCAAIYKRKYPGELKKYFGGLGGARVACSVRDDSANL